MKIYLTILSILFLQFGLARQLEVCNTCAIKTIKGALVKAADGDEIIIHSGFYQEGNILVDKQVHMRGIDFPILDGDNENEVLTILADNVTIEGLQVQNVGTSYLEDRCGIRMRKNKNFLITGNKLYNTFFGIYLERTGKGKVENNKVIGNAKQEMSSGNAIHLWYCKNIEVKNNVVKHHRDGIYFEFVDNSIVENNISENNLRYGLHFMFSNFDDYLNNEFRRNGAGVAVMFSKNINMFHNTFEYNWGKASFGLLLKEIYDAEIKNNIFLENTVGIYVEGSTRINYEANEFKRNGWALKISGGCLDNIIKGNNFIGNTFSLSMNKSHNNNDFTGNYWSDYAGYDLDRDGVGDVPHRPVKLFNFIVNETPEATVLLRSLFIDIINFSEKVSPVFTPKHVLDESPLMSKLTF